VNTQEELTKIVGAENVSDETESLIKYSEDISLIPMIRPKCIVKPRDVEEVQGVVKWANKTLTPIVPISSGAPHFRGGTTPSAEGAAIIDLRRMKKIIRIDRKNRVAMVEPGVTFSELIPKLKEAGLAPLMPLVPRMSKSVLTCALEREPILFPMRHWENMDPLCCTEIIFGSGDLFRTGSSAVGTLEEQWAAGGAQISGQGPAQVDFARLIQGAQGTMGVVTWASIQCKLLPKVKSSFFIFTDDFESLINLTYKLLWKKLGEECFILNNHNLACILSSGREDTISLRETLPAWVLIFSLEGGGLLPEEKVQYQENEALNIIESFGLKASKNLSTVKAEEVSDVICGPSDEPYWKLRFKGAYKDVFFLTTLDKTPDFITEMNRLADSYSYPVSDIGVYLQPTVQGTNCHCEFNISYDPRNQQESENVQTFVSVGSKSMAEIGGFFSRPYGNWKDFAYGSATEMIVSYKKVKNIFDPNHIMNPGKLCD